MRWIILVGLLLIAFGLSVRFIWLQQPKLPQPFVAPVDWKEIDLEHFSFDVPPDMKPESEHGIDSAVWRYNNSNIRLTIDWGPYPGAFEPYRDQPEYKEEWIKVDGKTAHFWSFRFSEEYVTAALGDKRYGAAICFADTETKSMNLTFSAACKTKNDQETAKIIFQSIRFK